MKCQAFSVEAPVIKLTEQWWIELIVEINNNDNVFAILIISKFGMVSNYELFAEKFTIIRCNRLKLDRKLFNFNFYQQQTSISKIKYWAYRRDEIGVLSTLSVARLSEWSGNSIVRFERSLGIDIVCKKEHQS